MTTTSRANNFDLIRLLAAFQVAVYHGISHLAVATDRGATGSDPGAYFPGVPIFFTISGFLIYQSFRRNEHDLRAYIFNRAVRIYPGLVVTFALSLLLILLTAPAINTRDLFVWSTAQLTIFQYFTPASLRTYGVGTPNGALWTIPVELEFYAVLPLLYFWHKRRGAAPLVLVFVLSVASYMIAHFVLAPEGIVSKIFFVTVVPYLFNFLIGMAIAIWFSQLEKVLKGKGAVWLGAYLCLNVLNGFRLRWWDVGYTPNVLGVANTVILGLTVVSLAFTAPTLSGRLLRGNDVSYGVYIYHMPVINWMVQRGVVGHLRDLFTALLLTSIIATLSWQYVESPFLRLKRRRRAPAPTVGESV